MTRGDGVRADRSSISDDELRVPLGLADRSNFPVKFTETGHTFEALPRLGLWIICLSLAIPTVILVWALFFGPARRGIVPDSWWTGAVVIACFAVPTTFLLFYGLDRAERTKGKMFVLDLTTGTLELPRRKTTVLGSQVREVVELRGWARLGDGIEKFVEIGVIVDTQQDGLVRHPLLFDTGPQRPIAQAAQRLADYFKVPLRVIQRDRRDVVDK